MYALIINPISGNGRGRQEQPRVEALLRRESLPYRTFVAESAAEARTYARQAVEEKMTGVIAVGGDGTLFQIINGLAGSELTLLFACCGTGNDFARTLRLPKDPVEALQAQLHAPLSRIDIGRMNDTYFLNVSGTGFDVEVLRQAEKVEGAKLILLPDLTGMDDEFAPSVMDRIVRATSGRLIEIPAHPVFSSVSYKQATPPRCRLASHRTYSTRRRTPAFPWQI